MNSMPVIINTIAAVDPAKRSLDDEGGGGVLRVGGGLGGGKGRKRLENSKHVLSVLLPVHVVMWYM